MSLHFGKSVIACMAMLFCFGTEANAQKKLCLQEIETQMEGDYTYNGYNKDGQLDSTYIYLAYDDDEIYKVYEYDENGNMTKVSGFCILPSNDNEYREFTKTYDIVYGYDENNRRISRRNYNLDVFGGTGEYLLGGVYAFEYDENGVLMERKLYWDDAMTDLFETTKYTYDENGRLVLETYMQHSFGSVSEEMVLNYFYDEEGRLIRLRTDVMNYNTGAIEEDDNLIYTYDENGNLISRIAYATDPTTPNEEQKFVYYTDTLAADVCMPINYEDEMDFYLLSKNVVKQDTIYRRDMETNSFDLYDIQDWRYAEFGTSSGIESVLDNAGKIFSISKDSEGNVLLNGVGNNENVRIYDVNGRIVSNGAYNGRVNVNALPKGMYIIATRNGSVKISK